MCTPDLHPIAADMARLMAERAANGQSVTDTELAGRYSTQEVRAHFDAATRAATRSMTRTIHRPRNRAA